MKTELNTHNLSLFIALSPNDWTIRVSGCFPHSLIRRAPPPPSLTHKSTELPAWLWGARGQSEVQYRNLHTLSPCVYSFYRSLHLEVKRSVKFSPFSQACTKPGLVSLHFQQPKINHGVNRQVKWKKASVRPDSSEAPVASNPRTGVSKWLSSKTVCLRLDCLYMKVAWGFSSSFTKVALPAWVFVTSRIG